MYWRPGFAARLRYRQVGISFDRRGVFSMRKSASVGLLIGLALTCSPYVAQPALAQAASPTSGSFVNLPSIPGVSTNLSLVQQLLDSAGQLEQSALAAGNSNLNANIARLNPSASSSSGGASASTGSGSSGR